MASLPDSQSPTIALAAYHTAYRGIVTGPDGSFDHFLRSVDSSHLKNGHWRFGSVEDERRTHALGLATPEDVLIAQDRSNESEYNHISLRWVPGSNDKYLNVPLIGTAAHHLRTIYETRRIVGKALSFRGQIPVYIIEDNENLCRYWKAKYEHQQLSQSKAAASEESHVTIPSRPLVSPITPVGTPKSCPSQHQHVSQSKAAASEESHVAISPRPPVSPIPPVSNPKSHTLKNKPSNRKHSALEDTKVQQGEETAATASPLSSQPKSTTPKMGQNQAPLPRPVHRLSHSSFKSAQYLSPFSVPSPFSRPSLRDTGARFTSPHTTPISATTKPSPELAYAPATTLSIQKEQALVNQPSHTARGKAGRHSIPAQQYKGEIVAARSTPKRSKTHEATAKDIHTVAASTPDASARKYLLSSTTSVSSSFTSNAEEDAVLTKAGRLEDPSSRAEETLMVQGEKKEISKDNWEDVCSAIDEVATSCSPTTTHPEYFTMSEWPGLVCMGCGGEDAHTWDCHINTLIPKTKFTILDYRSLADKAEAFDPGPWTTHFDPNPERDPEDPKEQVKGMAKVIRGLETYKNDPELHDLPDEFMILLWALKTSPGLEVIKE